MSLSLYIYIYIYICQQQVAFFIVLPILTMRYPLTYISMGKGVAPPLLREIGFVSFVPSLRAKLRGPVRELSFTLWIGRRCPLALVLPQSFAEVVRDALRKETQACAGVLGYCVGSPSVFLGFKWECKFNASSPLPATSLSAAGWSYRYSVLGLGCPTFNRICFGRIYECILA